MRRRLTESIKQHEGLRLKAYQDTEGVWTIGYGTNLQVLQIGFGLAEDWLVQAIAASEDAARSIPLFAGLSSVRRDVITEMVYNLGLAGVLRFSNMWKAIGEEDWEGAAKEMLDSKWHRQVGQRARLLAGRMRQGKWTPLRRVTDKAHGNGDQHGGPGESNG